MGQVSWRTDDELLERVRRSARDSGMSVNGFINRVMDMATAEDLDDSEAVRLRHRLRAADLLAHADPPTASPASEAEVAEARVRAGSGTSLSDLVDTMRS